MNGRSHTSQYWLKIHDAPQLHLVRIAVTMDDLDFVLQQEFEKLF